MHATFANPLGTDVFLVDDEGACWAVKPDDPRLGDMPVAPYVPPAPPPAPTLAELQAQMQALAAQLAAATDADA